MMSRANIDNQMSRDRANTQVATPNTMTAWNMRTPTRRVMARRANTSVISKEPTAGAARSNPNPQGPVCRMSRA